MRARAEEEIPAVGRPVIITSPADALADLALITAIDYRALNRHRQKTGRLQNQKGSVTMEREQAREQQRSDYTAKR